MAGLNFGSLNASGWAWAYFLHLRRQTRAVSSPATLEADIKKRAKFLFDERVESLPDRKSCMVLTMCCLVLASYRELERELQDSAKAYDIVSAAFQKTFAMPIRWLHRVKLLLARDPVDRMQRGSLAREANQIFGKIMSFSNENSEGSADLVVTHCAFHQFFSDHGLPKLTLMFCAWDRNWMDVIDRSTRPVRTERPVTLSTGASYCRFRHVRDASTASGGDSDVILDHLRKSANSP